MKQTDGCSPRRARWRLPSLLAGSAVANASNAAVSQYREIAGLAARSATFFGGCLWWPLQAFRAEEGFSKRRRHARVSASANAAVTAHLTTVTRWAKLKERAA